MTLNHAWIVAINHFKHYPNFFVTSCSNKLFIILVFNPCENIAWLTAFCLPPVRIWHDFHISCLDLMFDHCTIIIILVLTSWVGILEFVRGLRTQKVKIKSTPVFTLNKMGKTEVYFSLHSSWGECQLCFEHCSLILGIQVMAKTTFVGLLV